jgi:hypothetical protein
MKKYVMLTLVFLLPVMMVSSCKKKELSGLDKIWETEPVLQTPESVMYDSANDLFYVSNINGKPLDKDGNGFISKVGLDGKILALKWVEGFDAPKGMGIYKDNLYVTDIDSVAQISIKDGKITARYKAKDARFLNDIAIDTAGTLYVSDTDTNRIYRLKDAIFEVWNDSKEVAGPNGMYMKGDIVVVGVKGAILNININDNSLSTEVGNTETGGVDGLKLYGKESYIISDWAGKVMQVGKNIKGVVLSDTTPQKINAADFEYLCSKNMIYVPTFFDNRVVAYRLK